MPIIHVFEAAAQNLANGARDYLSALAEVSRVSRAANIPLWVQAGSWPLDALFALEDVPRMAKKRHAAQEQKKHEEDAVRRAPTWRASGTTFEAQLASYEDKIRELFETTPNLSSPFRGGHWLVKRPDGGIDKVGMCTQEQWQRLRSNRSKMPSAPYAFAPSSRGINLG